MANTIFWVIVAIIVVALVAYLVAKRGKPKRPEVPSEPEIPAETPPTEGPEI